MIQIEPTPNPNSLKFLSEKTISAIGTEEFQKDNIGDLSNEFIKELLNFKGVELIDKFIDVCSLYSLTLGCKIFDCGLGSTNLMPAVSFDFKYNILSQSSQNSI